MTKDELKIALLAVGNEGEAEGKTTTEQGAKQAIGDNNVVGWVDGLG